MLECFKANLANIVAQPYRCDKHISVAFCTSLVLYTPPVFHTSHASDITHDLYLSQRIAHIPNLVNIIRQGSNQSSQKIPFREPGKCRNRQVENPSMLEMLRTRHRERNRPYTSLWLHNRPYTLQLEQCLHENTLSEQLKLPRLSDLDMTTFSDCHERWNDYTLMTSVNDHSSIESYSSARHSTASGQIC